MGSLGTTALVLVTGPGFAMPAPTCTGFHERVRTHTHTPSSHHYPFSEQIFPKNRGDSLLSRSSWPGTCRLCPHSASSEPVCRAFTPAKPGEFRKGNLLKIEILVFQVGVNSVLLTLCTDLRGRLLCAAGEGRQGPLSSPLGTASESAVETQSRSSV